MSCSLASKWDETGTQRWAVVVFGNTWPTMNSGIRAMEAISTRVAEVLGPVAVAERVPAEAIATGPVGTPAGFAPAPGRAGAGHSG